MLFYDKVKVSKLELHIYIYIYIHSVHLVVPLKGFKYIWKYKFLPSFYIEIDDFRNPH